MNTVQKLFAIVLAKSEDKTKWRTIPSKDKQQINRIYKALKWMKGNEEKDEAQREFFSYFDPKDASIIKNAYQVMFHDQTT